MGNMAADLAGKKVLVLSDNDRLSRAIEVNLNRHLSVKVVTSAPSLLEQRGSLADNDHFDLIVVAMSSPASEPVVALARASLADRIGQMPLLIISDRPFRSATDAQIIHMDFPFDAHEFRDTVKGILGRE